MTQKDHEFMFWFFAGGETRDDRFNVFTGSFIRLMEEILGHRFSHVKGIYYRHAARNVAWALSNAQYPIARHSADNIPSKALRHIFSNGHSTDTQHIMVSSSSGSIVAAQTACLIASKNRTGELNTAPFHIAMGSSMLSKQSLLYRNLEECRTEGLIGNIILDDLQDEGDDSAGIGGLTRKEAFMNAFGLMFPVFSSKFRGPSFLNTHPVKGHIHRRRSQQVQKAADYIKVLLVKHNLAGEAYRQKAENTLNKLREEGVITL